MLPRTVRYVTLFIREAILALLCDGLKVVKYIVIICEVISVFGEHNLFA